MKRSRKRKLTIFLCLLWLAADIAAYIEHKYKVEELEEGIVRIAMIVGDRLNEQDDLLERHNQVIETVFREMQDEVR